MKAEEERINLSNQATTFQWELELKDRIIGRRFNQSTRRSDPTDHAEIFVLRHDRSGGSSGNHVSY